MNEHNIIGLREMLEQLPTPKLDEMLQTELMKDVPDEEAVRVILRVLEDREKAEPLTFTPGEEAAWKRYQDRITIRKKRRFTVHRWLAVAASLTVVVFLMVAVIPQQAEAENFWEMLQRLSSSVIEFLGREDKFTEDEYFFKTDNPGLQQIYDTVVELGITEPVVPMWLPEGSELTDFGSTSSPMKESMWAYFSHDKGGMVYKIDIYKGEPAHQYYKDDSHYEKYELKGTVFHIARNNQRWLVVWSNDSVECSIFIDCQEETLKRILKSIYTMEE